MAGCKDGRVQGTKAPLHPTILVPYHSLLHFLWVWGWVCAISKSSAQAFGLRELGGSKVCCVSKQLRSNSCVRGVSCEQTAVFVNICVREQTALECLNPKP